ncbi:MAG: hypothetical protein AAF226_11440, partial [Verrucomicrobiota bacterium]
FDAMKQYSLEELPDAAKAIITAKLGGPAKAKVPIASFNSEKTSLVVVGRTIEGGQPVPFEVFFKKDDYGAFQLEPSGPLSDTAITLYTK